MADLTTLTDAERLDWIGERGYVKSRMADVLAQMREYDIREAIDRAKLDDEAERILVRQLLSGNGGTE
jgi:hypothetical protein